MSQITPELVAEHGLTTDEYQLILDAIGREPSLTELGIFSVMWSEHCSYKSSRHHFKHFPTRGSRVMQGPGENAGIVDIGDGLAVVFKMESHNHPSFIEPFQGAATGVGGILRDIFTMGARPIAIMDSLRFGATEHPRTRYLVNGVVSGIAHYGNCMGIPTVGGELQFDTCYNGNILVNVFALGIARHEELFFGRASGLGNPVIYVGSRTGRDGIHGATMASEAFDEGAEARRPTVQVGDPFTEKLLLEACLEAMASGVVVGIQDMGAAGLTCATFEMAARGSSGMDVDLGLVPCRASNMSPYEILLSESQERMLLVVEKGREQPILEIFGKWDLEAVVIGTVTDTQRVRIDFGGARVVDLPVNPVTDGAPCYERPTAAPVAPAREKLKAAGDVTDCLLELLGRPEFADKSWVYEQYDYMVRTNTVVRPGADAAVLRLPGTNRALAMTCDCNPRYCALDPYVGAQRIIAEATRNLACVGAEPIGVTDCLNFGNPEVPQVMGQFVEAVKGIGDACRVFRIPVISGNVSFYNETDGVQIHPTPTIGMVGLIDALLPNIRAGFARAGDEVALLGYNRGSIDGSAYQLWCNGRVSGRLSPVDLDLERRVQTVCRQALHDGLLTAAHDCSDGGLALTLAEMAICSPDSALGCSVTAETTGLSLTEWLFGEDEGRIVVTFADEDREAISRIAEQYHVPITVLGRVIPGRLIIAPRIDLPLEALVTRWKDGLRGWMNA